MRAYELKNKAYHFLFICSITLTSSYSFGQNIHDQKVLTYKDAVNTIDTAVFGSLALVEIDNDTLMLAFQKALSYYPELWDKKIKLKYGKVKTSMTSRPRILSVFRKRDKRLYKITISNKKDYKPALLVNTAPFNALVGVLGHELAHVEDYSNRSGWAVTWMGIRYVFSQKYRSQMEHYTDSLAMSKGLQWQVYHYAYYVVNDADIDESYRRYKLNIYMPPEQVRDLAVKLDSLQNINVLQK